MAGSLELMSGTNSLNPYANTDFAKASQGDINNGRWGIDNWFRNLFSFGDYDRGRDAAYQLYLNNTPNCFFSTIILLSAETKKCPDPTDISHTFTLFIIWLI